MSYLLDKKIKRNKYFKYILSIIVLFLLIYFKAAIFSGFSYVAQMISRPVLVLGNNVAENFLNSVSYFSSKNALFLENKNLKTKLNEEEAKISNYNSILDENLKMKEILERKAEKIDMVLASILSKPNQSPYDTIIIDVGTKNGISVGQKVFAIGNVPIGEIKLVYSNSAKVVLYSTPGEITEVVVSGQENFVQIVGRGGGNFEMVLPRDFVVEKGMEVVLPGINPYTVAIVQTIISDPRDSFKKALLVSPVNIQEIKFVEVEK